MTSANRLRTSYVMESTPGVTPTTPRMRTVRITGETLTGGPEYVDSDELRADRMLEDPIPVGMNAAGGINFELSYPHPGTFLSDGFRSVLYSDWLLTPERDNDGVADSVITALANGTDVATVTTGPAFVAGQLVRFTGFTASANNGVFRCTTGSATVPAFVGAGFAAEAAPPSAARMKVVGFEGIAGDITALADGLGSTALDFTTLGLRAGQWVKIGGTADASAFAFQVSAGTDARAIGFARISAPPTATKLTLDNLPAGWSVDAGTGKTIRVWFGDQLKNGVTPAPMTIERGFMGQAAPTYIVHRGMHGGQLELTMTAKTKINGTLAFTGMRVSSSTTSLDSAPDPESSNPVMAGSAHVGRVAEAGSIIAAPNWARSLTLNVNANLAPGDALDSIGPVKVDDGECTVTGRIETYFGSNALLSKYLGAIEARGAVVTALSGAIVRNNQALITQVPRAVLRGGGNPSAGGKNTQVMAAFDYSGAKDPATGANIIFDRLEYFQP